MSCPLRQANSKSAKVDQWCLQHLFFSRTGGLGWVGWLLGFGVRWMVTVGFFVTRKNGGVQIPETYSKFKHLKMDGWNTFSFPFGAKGLFLGAILVSGSVIVFKQLHLYFCLYLYLFHYMCTYISILVHLTQFSGWEQNIFETTT